MKLLPMGILCALCTMTFAATITPKTPAKSSAGCYVISDAAELYGFAAVVNGANGNAAEKSACATLANNIVVNKNVLNEDGTLNTEASADFVPWTPISVFSGKFDGNGHTISGLFFDDPEEQEDEVFGFIRSLIGTSTEYAELKNFGIVDSYFGVYVETAGVVAGELAYISSEDKTYAKISGVYSTSTLYGYRMSDAGGLIGKSNGILEMENSYNRGAILGDNISSAGGLVGYVSSYGHAKISNCFSVWNLNADVPTRFGPFKGKFSEERIEISNAYFLESQGPQSYSDLAMLEQAVTLEQFQNGAVAVALHEGVNGSIWGQNVGTDSWPNFSGEVKNSTSQKYNVTFHTFDGDTATYFDSYVSGLLKILPTEVVKENTTFCCWSTSREFGDENLRRTIEATETGDKEYWAYLLNHYPVTFHTNGGEIEEEAIDHYQERIGADLPVKVLRDSFFFAGWYENEDLTGTPKFAVDSSERGAKTFYAAWYKLKMPEVDADSCFAISDAAELYGFAAYVNGAHGMHNGRVTNVCAKLTKDIVVNENVIKNGKLNTADTAKFLVWEPIMSFTGTFDGQGHTISGLYFGGKYGDLLNTNPVNTSRLRGVSGFIYKADRNGEEKGYAVIKNLGIEDSYLKSKYDIGGIVTDVASGELVRPVYGSDYVLPGSYLSIENCHFEGVLEGGTTVGGLVGSGELAIHNSYVKGSLSGYSVGGLVGTARDAVITDSYNNANIVASGYAGGLVANFSGNTRVDNCYNTGNVEGWDDVGGLLGDGRDDSGESYLSLTRSYNTGNVYATSGQAVGLVGVINYPTIIANNYNLGDISSGGEYLGRVAGIADVWLYDVDSLTLDSVFIVNNYSMCSFTLSDSMSDYFIHPTINHAYKGNATFENNFFLQRTPVPIPNYDSLGNEYGLPATAAEFKDSTVAKALRSYVKKADGGFLKEDITGDVWTQGKDHPILAVPKSSSSSVASSSSETSSSSIASSSSKVKSSSSEAKSSSSECKGKKCKDALLELAMTPTFRITVMGRELQVAGARVGASFALLDMQGRVLRTGTVGESNFSVMVPRAGGYLVRIGDEVGRVIAR